MSRQEAALARWRGNVRVSAHSDRWECLQQYELQQGLQSKADLDFEACFGECCQFSMNSGHLPRELPCEIEGGDVPAASELRLGG